MSRISVPRMWTLASWDRTKNQGVLWDLRASVSGRRVCRACLLPSSCRIQTPSGLSWARRVAPPGLSEAAGVDREMGRWELRLSLGAKGEAKDTGLAPFPGSGAAPGCRL